MKTPRCPICNELMRKDGQRRRKYGLSQKFACRRCKKYKYVRIYW